MSKYTKIDDNKPVVKEHDSELSLNIKDTDFLLRLIKRSSFSGEEIEVGYKVIQKLGIIHRSYLED
jgi:hypothetical protein|tara:strand:- start:2071 stop:2268 length:198 start_codon:yes stop_codon:yes gene_type:complete